MKNWQDGDNKRYFFILGREAHLAIIELIAVLRSHSLPYNIRSGSREVLIIETAQALSIALFERLGGMIKFGECLFERHSPDALDEESFLSYFNFDEERILFGFSLYDLGGSASLRLREIKSGLERRALSLKKILKTKSPRVRYVSTKDLALSSVAVLTNKLMRAGGYEFVILASQNKFVVGRTVAVQDWSEFRHRDFGRPVRDPKRGTLPPKLARVLLNLSGAKETDLVLDCFSGDGTILTEAIALNFKKLIGADIDEVAVAHTRKNVDWAIQEYGKKAEVKLFVSDARALPSLLGAERVRAVVSEGDLGAPLRERFSQREAELAVLKISQLYREALGALAGVIEHGGRIVLALPHYPTVKGNFGISFDPIILHNLRLAPVDLWPTEIVRNFGRFGRAGTYIYGRENQKVEREIFVFEKM